MTLDTSTLLESSFKRNLSLFANETAEEKALSAFRLAAGTVRKYS